MKTLLATFALIAATAGHAAVKNGDVAPDFKLKGYDGKEYSLSQYKGKTVVLEWVNFECPFVRKHYDSKNMQNIQAAAKKDGVIWLSVLSSAKGKQGHLEGKALEAAAKKEGSNAVTILQDFDGKVGKQYDAKTTPHLYIINEEGKLAYQGAIDDHPSTDAEDIAKSKNYVTEAIRELKAKKPVTTAETKAYGCGVKY